MNKTEAVELALDAVGYSRMLNDLAEFMYFVERTPYHADQLIKTKQKLLWDIKTHDKLLQEKEHGES